MYHYICILYIHNFIIYMMMFLTEYFCNITHIYPKNNYIMQTVIQT